MMRARFRTFLAWAAISVLALTTDHVAANEPGQQTTAVILGFDLDGLAAVDTAIFADTNIVASTSYTITAQPDACRALVATVTDANASLVSGTVTVAGTDGNGQVQSATFVLTGGSGTRAIGGIWCSITSISNGATTVIDAGTDKIRVGTVGIAPMQYPVAWGTPFEPGLGQVSAGVKIENPADAFQPNAVLSWRTFGDNGSSGSLAARLIKTAGTSATTSITSFTASSGSLTGISIGDLILVNDASGNPIQAAVVAKADNDNATLDRTVLLTKAAGHGYSYRQRKVRTAQESGWFTVNGYTSTTVSIDVAAMTGSGGIDFQVECMPRRGLHSMLVKTLTNIASASVVEVQITQPYDVCRVGLQWHTGDDADASAGAEERINIYAIGRR